MQCFPLKVVIAAALMAASRAIAEEASARLVFDYVPSARFEFGGPIGERVHANIENWLLRAPQSNPGMIEMFRVRDRKPAPQLVPWAGEFVGKYLISAVQALRMSDDPRLRKQVEQVVAEFISAQAEDGYLGPFPRQEQLLGHWDLWGHYHAILALVMWNEYSGDASALAAARKAADLVCKTYLDTNRRVFDAGDHEMNMSILTAMAMLHRITGEARYLRMAREVEKDWERAGDYLRAGLDGREYFRSPKPRWESLHDLQGLVELWRVTGETKYRDAFVHHWRSIRRWDRRNTGAFSSGEQATGNPYAPTAIETCCSVAWMALTIDYLRLTGDPRAADDLELATLNGGLGAQHPSGRWWTYNTPMDGVREASAHSIVFQARAGTPELNCCSVNGPRVLGMLSEWAVMSATNGLFVNWLGAGKFTGKLADGSPVTITSSRDAWRDGQTKLTVSTPAKAEFPLRIRIPEWAREVKVNGQRSPDEIIGSYFPLRVRQETNVELSFQIPLRFAVGANEAAGKVSLYRGPILLVYDQGQNNFDEGAIPSVMLERLMQAHVAAAPETSKFDSQFRPWLLVDVPAVDGRTLRLMDFASAGAKGTRYRSWLLAHPAPPPPAFTQVPPDGARVAAWPTLFRWRGPRTTNASYRVEFSADESFQTRWSTNVSSTRMLLDTRLLSRFADAHSQVFWRVVTLGKSGDTTPDLPPARFEIAASVPHEILTPEPKLGPNGELVSDSLRGDTPAQLGELKLGKSSARDSEGTELNGRDQVLIYTVPSWPEDDFTVSVRVRINELPRGRIGQIFSAWSAGMDDPLRLVVDGGKLFARVEAGTGFSTPGAPVEAGHWYAVAATKRGATLTLYLDGRATGSCAVPEFSNTQAQDCALGGNPHFSGNEFLAARFADFRLHAKALSEEEIRALATPKP